MKRPADAEKKKKKRQTETQTKTKSKSFLSWNPKQTDVDGQTSSSQGENT